MVRVPGPQEARHCYPVTVPPSSYLPQRTEFRDKARLAKQSQSMHSQENLEHADPLTGGVSQRVLGCGF